MEKFTYEINTEPKDSINNKIKKVRKTPTFKYYFFNILLALIIIIIIGFLAVGLFCNLENVKYSETKYAKVAPIREAVIGDSPLENSVCVYVIRMFKSPGKFPFVEKVSVKLVDRNTIYLDIKEKELNAAIDTAKGKYVYIDKTGDVCEVSKEYLEGIPLISGLKVGKAKMGEKAPVNDKNLKYSLEIIKYLNDTNYHPSNIVFDSDSTFGFYIGDIFVDLGTSENLEDKVRRLPQILGQLEGESGILYMSGWSHDNTDIIFKQN